VIGVGGISSNQGYGCPGSKAPDLLSEIGGRMY
jgi:hypothetical protein